MQRATTRTRGAATLAAALAMASWEYEAIALQDEPRYAPVALETNFEDEDPARTKRVQPVLDKSATDALKRRHGIEVVTTASTTIAFFVRNLEEDPKAKRELAVMNYGVLIEIRTDGKKVGDKVVFCTQKGEAELVDCAIEGIPQILEYLPVQDAPPDIEGTSTPGQGNDEITDTKPVRPAAIGPMGIAGIVLGSAGLGTTIAGAVDLGRGRVVEPSTRTGFDRGTDYRPRGRALLGAGLGMAVVGAVLVAVDVGLRAKKRKQRPLVEANVSVRPGFAGVYVGGRF